MTRLGRPRPAYAVGRACDVCGGEGLVELAPLVPGRFDGKWACAVCRFQATQKLAAQQEHPPRAG